MPSMSTPDQASPVARAVRALAQGRLPGETLTYEAFGQIMEGEASAALMTALLTGLNVRGATADEVTGAVRALRAAMLPVRVADRARLIDTCGTGGGSVGTFNVSTAAALVAVGAGATVAKHGNRSYTSKCGSADVLEALGVEIMLDPERAGVLIERVGMAFLFAPAFHPAMRHMAPVRRELGVPTIMNVAGPLANPAGVTRQLLGVADRRVGPIVAEVLRRLGAEHALVVSAAAGMDEIAPAGATEAWEVRDGGVTELTIDPASLGEEVDDLAALVGGEPAENAARVERLLAEPGRDRAGRAAVVLNAGAACYVAGLAATLGEGIELASSALEEGRGAEALERLKREAGISTSE